MVKNHYAGLGFALLEQHKDGTARWQLDVAGAAAQPIPMTVKRSGFVTLKVEDEVGAVEQNDQMLGEVAGRFDLAGR
jgi:hypothetical protein